VRGAATAGRAAAIAALAAPALRVFVRDIGLPGIIGLCLLLASGPAWWAMVRAPQREAAEIKADMAHLRARRLAAADRVVALSPAQQIERFRAVFPEADTTPAALARISRLAAANKVALASGDYRLAEERALGMVRYEVRYPVKGAWRDVFTLLAALLNEMPSLAIDEVVFKRESRNAAQVEAQLRLSLYFTDTGAPPQDRAEPASGAAPAVHRGGAGG